MNIDSLSNLVNNINNSLGDFKRKFAYKRKECAKLGKAPNRSMFFKYENEDRDWAINEGGGTEIQYHIYMREDDIGYGLGFNAQYVQFKNEKSPRDYIKPFVDAFVILNDNQDKRIDVLEKKGFSLKWCNWDELTNIQNNDYYFFGKTIKIDNGVISDEDYDDMIDTIQKELFDLYIAIWEEKNNMEQINKTIMEDIEKIKVYSNLVQKNYNLILTGAPGTGKTYLAKQIAQQMIFGEIKKEMSDDDKKQFNEQCAFVQFHPSYDYTDFVEGLRPKNENGDVGFKRKDGVFKEFCSRALKNSFENTIDNFEETWNRLVAELSEKDYLDVPLLSGKNKFLIELNEYGDGLANRTYEKDKYEKGNWIRGQSKFFSKEQCYNIYKGLPGIPSGAHDNYRKAIVNYMKNKMGMDEYKEGNMSKDKVGKYVFIIDEINRGEISKIFGELFFAIDPGYRGSEKCSGLRTQYANLQESMNVFDEVLKITDADNFGHFFVPENVYIIGTMNDIDRSVESMDFAFRRRFAFKEITAEETQSMLDKDDAWKIDGKSFKPDVAIIDNIKNRMNNLNNKIWSKEKDDDKNIEGLSSAYHIGASYFLKLVNYRTDDNSYDNESFEKLWNYHLQGLLREYLRGMQNVDEKINLLKAAYDNESDTNN